MGSGEISLSGFLPRNQSARAEFDLSQAVGDLDFYFEGALGQEAAGEQLGVFEGAAAFAVAHIEPQPRPFAELRGVLVEEAGAERALTAETFPAAAAEEGTCRRRTAAA